MATTITNGVDTITPTLVNGYRTARPSRNIEHDILDRADPDVSLQAAGTRSGVLELVFDTEADAAEAEDLHAGTSTWLLGNTDHTTVDMAYVLAAGGTLERELDDTRKAWIVRVPYREVIV
jgi:hypothetical protein